MENKATTYAAPEQIVDTSVPWYVLKTRGGTEEKLAHRIQKKADRSLYEHCWIPTKTERRKYHGEVRDVKLRLFTGYVFISTSSAEKLFLYMRNRDDFLRILGEESQYIPLDDSDVEWMKKLTGWGRQDGFGTNVDMSVGVIIEGKLKVLEGPLVGMEEHIVEIRRDKKKAWVEMVLFNELKRFPVGLEVIRKE